MHRLEFDDKKRQNKRISGPPMKRVSAKTGKGRRDTIKGSAVGLEREEETQQEGPPGKGKRNTTRGSAVKPGREEEIQ